MTVDVRSSVSGARGSVEGDEVLLGLMTRWQ